MRYNLNLRKLLFGIMIMTLLIMSNNNVISIDQSSIGLTQNPTTTLTHALPYDFTEFGYFTAYSYATQQWLSAVRASLFRYDASNDRLMTPWFAEGYEISSDGKNYTVTIKAGMKFQDGSPFTADDVVFAYGVYYHDIFGGADGIMNNESVHKIDDLTVKFDMMQAYAFGVSYLSKPILNEAYFGPKWAACVANGATVEADCLWDDPSGVDAHGGGPYMVQSIDITTDVVTLVKNPHYFDASNVYFDELVFKKNSNPIDAINALAAGDIDIIDSQFVPPLEAFNEFDNVASLRVTDPATQEISLNHLHPMYGTGEDLPLGSTITSAVEGAKAVREAMSSVLNRESLIEEIFEGRALPAATVVPATATGWNPNLAFDPYDVAHARSLMESVGFNYGNLNYNSINDEYTSFFFNVTLLSANTSPSRNLWPVFFEQSLPKIGIGVTDHVSTGWAEINLRTFGWSSNTLVPLYDDGGYDVFFVGYGFPLDYDPQYIFDTNGLCDSSGPGACKNWYNFVNQEITDLVDLYVRELDGNTRITLIGQIQDFLKAWRPVIPSIYPQSHWGHNVNLTGIDGILLSTSNQQWDQVKVQDLIPPPSNNSSTPVNQTSDNSVDNGDLDGFSSILVLSSMFVMTVLYRKKWTNKLKI
ncbi:MAG: ABC transporter substrate-binding protein [Candidatus Heimdallarchaeota archaeon]|nr:ABC transporter substrate-binding protein [Candidatus Heimdallarchaeota archaeon]MDH5644691.1 ABC transporter substrate-binding protein [Candidatus Heimdallarchaeota archaeon]